MTYQDFIEKTNKIKSLTKGFLKSHRALPGGWLCSLIYHNDEKPHCRVKDEPFFYTMVIFHPSFKKVKLLTMDYRKEAKKFWERFTREEVDRKDMLNRTVEISPDVLVINYNKSEYHDKGLCAS